MSETKAEYLPQPAMFESTNVAAPSAERLAEWTAKAQRVAPFGTARQMVLAVEVEIWVNDERNVAPDIVEALDKYMDVGTGIENGAELVLNKRVTLRHRFVNRYFSGGKLDAVVPPSDSRPALVDANGQGLQA